MSPTYAELMEPPRLGTFRPFRYLGWFGEGYFTYWRIGFLEIAWECPPEWALTFSLRFPRSRAVHFHIFGS